MNLYSKITEVISNAKIPPSQLVFEALEREFKTMPASSPQKPEDDVLRQSAEQLILAEKERKLTWLELYGFESILVRLRDDESLRRSAWSIRREVKQLASEDLWQDYQANKPDANAPIEVLRRDIEDLLRKLHELRLGRSLLEFIRAYTTVVTIGACATLVISVLVFACVSGLKKGPIAIKPNPVVAVAQPGAAIQPNSKSSASSALATWEPSMLWVATFAGIFGAAFSMLIRLGQIPTKGDLVARYPSASRRVVWALTPFASLVEGVIAAITLYFILRSELVSGSMFPKFTDMLAEKGFHPDAWLLVGSAPSALEAAKLGIWCFVAGFCERLVPDMLSRLAEQAEKASLAGADKKS